MDATEQARMVREKIASPLELVEEAIKVIKEKNPSLNAVVHERFESAREEAKNRNNEGKPFGGVPLLLKELGQNMAGLSDASGSRLLQNVRAQETNHLVSRLVDAGFIVLGQTNVPEFGFKNITDSQLYGDAKNPYDVRRTPGGSSGGSAAAVSSGMVQIAGASDGGGSIRIPASYTGLVGLKPSRGRMVVGPGNMRGWGGASTPFVLASSVRDTKSLLYLLEGKQPQAPYQIAPLPESDLWNELDFTSLRIGYTIQSPVGSAVSKDAFHAVESAIQLFQAQGAEVEEAAPEYDGVSLMEAYYVMNGAETAAMMQKIARGMNRSLTPSDMEPMTWAIYQYGLKLSAADYIDAFAVWDQAAEVMTNYHQQYDLFLTPTTAEVAPLLSKEYQSRELLRRLQAMDEGTSIIQASQLVYEMFEKSLAVTPFTQLANLTGQPAISLPLYVNGEKLPLGVQLMAQKGQEPLLIQIADFFENANLFRSAIE